MRAVEYRITTEFIELNQLLKVCGLADSGGAGGAIVTQGNVTVDGQQELRKRCKIRPGQVVQLGEARITVLAPDPFEVAARAEAKVVIAREKAALRTKAMAAKPKAAAPWGPAPGPKLAAKGGRRTGGNATGAAGRGTGVAGGGSTGGKVKTSSRGSGIKTGAATGAKSGTWAGARTGGKTGAAGTGAGAKTGAKLGAKFGAKTGAKTGAQSKKRGNVFAQNAESHRQRQKP